MLFLANKFDENKFKKFLSLKDNTILDFGAGVGIWKRSNKNVRINKIFLYENPVCDSPVVPLYA